MLKYFFLSFSKSERLRISTESHCFEKGNGLFWQFCKKNLWKFHNMPMKLMLHCPVYQMAIEIIIYFFVYVVNIFHIKLRNHVMGIYNSFFVFFLFFPIKAWKVTYLSHLSIIQFFSVNLPMVFIYKFCSFVWEHHLASSSTKLFEKSAKS